MLIGMESFLQDLSVSDLKAHCKELSLETSGPKKDLVDRFVLYNIEIL
jgi:hypothetical protein